MNPNIAALTSVIKSIRNVLFKKPLLAIYDTTKLCNQHCPMCNIRKNHSENMSLAELEETVKKLRRNGVGYVFIQGGEPLMRKDIIDVVDIFIKYSVKPTVITNGALLTKQLARQLADRRCNLAISIDSLERERYAYLRGSDDLPQVLKIIDEIAGITDRCGNWSITTTITRQSSFEDVKNIHAYAKEKGFMFAIRPYIAMTGNAGRKDENLVYSQEDVLAIFEHFLNIAKKENYLASLVYREHIRYIKGEPTPPCDAMKYSFLLKENGDMAPCIEMPDKKFTFETFSADKRKYKPLFAQCNREHPCFYNDAREIGILYRNVWKLALHAPQILLQMKRYKSFF